MTKALVQQKQRWYWTDTKPRYKFSHRAGKTYYWHAVKPVDSRVEEISCNVGWFWTVAKS